MSHPSYERSDDGRSVIIDDHALDELGTKIAQSIKARNSGEKSVAVADVDDCINNLNFASWDEEKWHYNASNYSRPNMREKQIDQQRFERVALYIMVMDCINFCFWPVDDDKAKFRSRNFKKNMFEYEHLASALKGIAEVDDVYARRHDCEAIPDQSEIDILIIRADDSYPLAPQNLIKLTTEAFLGMMIPLLPKCQDTEEEDLYIIPNAGERVRLIIEMAQSLLLSYHGSATYFISKANRSSDRLVWHILQSFPGFRDTAVDSSKGKWVAFYKRAQILVADLWAALGNENGKLKHGCDICNFYDMDKITTFADYRVPQLLRKMEVLRYSPSLSQKVDKNIEIDSSSMDEIYIRASTVVAVDLLVNNVKSKVPDLKKSINAVKMDWYLWNIGEKLDREGSLGNHHLVRTIFY